MLIIGDCAGLYSRNVLRSYRDNIRLYGYFIGIYSGLGKEYMGGRTRLRRYATRM